MMKDTFNIIGVPTIELYDSNGVLKQSLTQRNLIVDTGKEYFLRKIFDRFTGTEPLLEVIAVGSGTTPPTTADTGLESQIGTSTVSEYTFQSSNEITLLTGFIQGIGTGTINELGLLATDGTLISRIVVDTTFNKGPADFLNVNWSFQVG